MSANILPEIEAPPQSQPRKARLDFAWLRVHELLDKHPEYTSTEVLVALMVARHMRRQRDGFYHATLRQTGAGALVREVRASRRTVQRALHTLCASGGIFKAVPRFGQRGRLANEYVLIEAPKAYQAQRTEGGAAVHELTPRRPTSAERQAAEALCRDYAACYLELRHAPYEACPLDMKHALLLVREWGAWPDYLLTLCRAWVSPDNDKMMDEAYKLPVSYGARLLYQSRSVLKLIHQDWVRCRESWVPPELLT